MLQKFKITSFNITDIKDQNDYRHLLDFLQSDLDKKSLPILYQLHFIKVQTIVALRQPWDVDDLKYVFMRRMAEKELSLMAFALGLLLA